MTTSIDRCPRRAVIEIVPPLAPVADLLVAFERELAELVLEHGALRAAWPKALGAVERAAIGRRVEDASRRIADLQLAIIGMPTETVAGAAVKLRRLAAILDIIEPGRRVTVQDVAAARALLASALSAIEAGAQPLP